MSPPRIPTWKERLRACFQWRHRFLHVFGVPAALGSVVAVLGSSALSTDSGLALGVLAAGMGSLLAGYYVTAGFDRRLVDRLQTEEQSRAVALETGAIQRAIWEAEPELRPALERIISIHAGIESAFADGIDDQVETILQASRNDLQELRDRAISLAKLHQRLRTIIIQSDGQRLYNELQQITADLQRAPKGPVRDALLSAQESSKRTLNQWQVAVDKQAQIRSVLTVIETNLQEFKLAMELRKADAVMGSQAANPDVSELQARLAAAGQACDELVGRASAPARRSRQRSQ